MTRKFIIEITCENAAFADADTGVINDDGAGREVGAILKDVVRQVERGCIEGRILDTNGNHVGYYKTEGRKA